MYMWKSLRTQVFVERGTVETKWSSRGFRKRKGTNEKEKEKQRVHPCMTSCVGVCVYTTSVSGPGVLS